MNKLNLHNTRAHKKQEFTPLKDGEVSMYHCGPTVYGVQHLGNLRAFVVWDVLRRTLEYNNYKVRQVINITDIGHLVSDGDEGEDKMSKGLQKKGWDITLDNMIKLGREFEEKYISDLTKLNILLPHALPRASEHIQEDINIIQILVDKNFAYPTSDGMYFDTSKDPDYGKYLVKHQLKEGQARIEKNTDKRNPEDFALWKFDKSMGWNTPWGKGFPGWHIECSAMSEKYLGLPFDIHTGGIEHISVHHTNEIAQTENARGTEMSKFWLHNNHLQIEGQKISKSLENTVYLDDIEEKLYSPLDFRYLLLSTHYRKELNFTWEALEASSIARKRLLLHTQIKEVGSVIDSYRDRFIEAINDDLNTPQALAVVWDLVRNNSVSGGDKKATILDFDKIFGLKLDTHEEFSIPQDIKKMIEEREEARDKKDFDTSDRLRDDIQDKGYEVLDTDIGTEVRPI